MILGFCLEDEGGGVWIEGEGELSALLPVRQQILEGDYRALYLAWLKAHEFDDEAEDERVEPPAVPPGLRKLPDALKAFIEFFEIGDELVADAAKSSSDSAPEVNLEEWLPRLPENERTTATDQKQNAAAHGQGPPEEG